MGKVIGIDLGTTNSAFAIVENNSPDIIVNSEGKRTTPSIVSFTDDGFIVGDTAKNQRVMNSKNTISSVKIYMGQKKEFNIDDKKLCPEEISAKILQKIKKDASNYLGQDITQAVITVPAYFDNDQREATKRAGEIAGLEVLRIINEPTAAALAYGMDKKDKAQTILVYDYGGGTFDLSLLEIGDGIYEVKATCGDSHLGGDDLDKELYEYLLNEICKKYEVTKDSIDEIAKSRILEMAEKTKIELSSSLSSKVMLPFLFVKDSSPVSVEIDVNRAKFEELIDKFIEKTRKPIQQVLKDANIMLSDIDEVILVGGTTRIPYVVNKVREWTGKEPCRNVNPDEVVALGAAIQAAILSGDASDIVLLDVTPLTLSIETQGEIATPMIERNTTIPTSKKQIFTTAADGQTEVNIKIAQGERPMFFNNKQLGNFTLAGIPFAPRGVPQIEVEFSIDTNGILNVTAKDMATNKSQNIVISGNSHLEDSDIQRMIDEAKDNEEEDMKKKKKVEIKNRAEQTIYMANKMLSEHDEKISDALKEETKEAISTLENNKDTENLDVINQSIELLEKTLQKVGSELYESVRNNEETDIKDTQVVSDAASAA